MKLSFPCDLCNLWGMRPAPNKLLLLLSFLFLISSHPNVNAQRRAGTKPGSSSTGIVIESGKFRYYELKQVQGEESYLITRGPNGLVVKAKLDLPFWGEELKPLLNATLRMKDDLTPEQFEIKGIRPLEVPIDTSISVQGKTARVSEGNTTAPAGSPAMRVKQLDVPENFFTLAGYAPVAMEMMLVRYWLKHDLKAPLKLLPGGEAFLERRGKDTVGYGGKWASLDRYSLGGIRAYISAAGLREHFWRNCTPLRNLWIRAIEYPPANNSMHSSMG